MAKILVVDDERKTCKILKKFLKAQGHKVETASDSKEALEKLKSFQPALVLLDIRMPGVDGLKVLSRMKELDPYVRIFMVTALDDVEVAKLAVEEGAEEYITKPVDLHDLHSSIHSLQLDR